MNSAAAWQLRVIDEALSDLRLALGYAARGELVRARLRGLFAAHTLRIAVQHVLIPEPPRNSGEADAVHGPTALRTHHNNKPTNSPIDPGARP